MKIILLLLMLTLRALVVPAQERLVKANGHTFNVFTAGLENRNKNTPVIVFENGMGMGLDNWHVVMDELAATAPVFAYDRLGVEKSETVFQMPTVKFVADNLKALLSTLNIAPPYILVGHSMGGVYARAYAGLYPNEISALVFIDPADFTETKDDWNDIFRALGLPEERIEQMMRKRLYKKSDVDSVRFGPWSENEVLTDLRRNDFEPLRILPLPNAPIHFLVGGKFEVPPSQQSREYDQAKFFVIKSNRNMERWRMVIDASPKKGSLIYLANCGHYVHHCDPQAVIETILSIVRNVSAP